MRLQPIQILCLFAVATGAFAQSPFIGDWELNVDKSHVTGAVIRFSPAADGAITFTQGDQSSTFKTDGRQYAGDIAEERNVWKEIDASNYEMTVVYKGDPLYKVTYKISPDGKTLTTEEPNSIPEPHTETSTYVRVSGSKGLMGSWKETDVTKWALFRSLSRNDRVDTLMSWEAGASANTMRWDLPDRSEHVEISLDGKDCTPVGESVPKGQTLSLAKTGPNTVSSVEKLGGKVLRTAIYKLSPDGKTLTEVETPADGTAPVTIIYDRWYPAQDNGHPPPM